MSLFDSYDDSLPMITPSSFYRARYIADTCIVTFSHKVLNYTLEKYHYKKEVCTGTANGLIQIYSLEYNGKKILFYMSPIGSSIAGMVLDEVSFLTGASNFIFFGSCGSLDSYLTDGKLIIPTESYRDEGFSYHYAPAGDYIKITNADKLASIFKNLGIPYVSGKTWTTDAIYMETVRKIEKRKADGCITVEMESAGLQAICSYKNINLFIFFFVSDLLAGALWENMTLGTPEEKRQQINAFDIALKLTDYICNPSH